jgi:hypothetical protein
MTVRLVNGIPLGRAIMYLKVNPDNPAFGAFYHAAPLQKSHK